MNPCLARKLKLHLNPTIWFQQQNIGMFLKPHLWCAFSTLVKVFTFFIKCSWNRYHLLWKKKSWMHSLSVNHEHKRNYWHVFKFSLPMFSNAILSLWFKQIPWSSLNGTIVHRILHQNIGWAFDVNFWAISRNFSFKRVDWNIFLLFLGLKVIFLSC